MIRLSRDKNIEDEEAVEGIDETSPPPPPSLLLLRHSQRGRRLIGSAEIINGCYVKKMMARFMRDEESVCKRVQDDSFQGIC